MKKTLFILALALTSMTSLQAQMKEGKIVYERKVNMYRSITDPEMRARIPEFRTDKFELLFNEQSSLYRAAPDDEAPDPFANNGGDRGNGGGMRFNFRGMEATIFTDIKAQTQYEARAILEKNFLIVDSVKTYKWKISDETKTIAKHLCKKATTLITPQQMTMRFGGGGRRNRDTAAVGAAPIKPKEVEVVVWYTEEIPVSVGPDNYSGLPGVILEIDNDNGGNVTTAVEITTKYPKKELVQPTKGDKMTRTEFGDAMKKIMEDMQKGGGMMMGGMRVRASNN